MSFQNGNFTSGKTTATLGGTAIPTDLPSNYKVQVFSKNGAILADYNFIIPNQEIFEPSQSIFDFNGNQVSLPDVNIFVESIDTNFALVIPYFDNIVEAKIFDNNVHKLTINLSNFSTKVKETINYGGGIISNPNYSMKFELTSQPAATLISQNYKLQLGGTFYHED